MMAIIYSTRRIVHLAISNKLTLPRGTIPNLAYQIIACIPNDILLIKEIKGKVLNDLPVITLQTPVTLKTEDQSLFRTLIRTGLASADLTHVLNTSSATSA